MIRSTLEHDGDVNTERESEGLHAFCDALGPVLDRLAIRRAAALRRTAEHEERKRSRPPLSHPTTHHPVPPPRRRRRAEGLEHNEQTQLCGGAGTGGR